MDTLSLIRRVHAERDLGADDKNVLIALLAQADERGHCAMSRAALAAATSLCPRQVRYVVQRLVERHLLCAEPGQGRGHLTRYDLTPLCQGAPRILANHRDGAGL